jgi:predicted RNA-binding Zn-ribbon protein involved in translation (DUF1610 family)
LLVGVVTGAICAGVIRLLAYFGGSTPGYEQTDETSDALLADRAERYAAAWQDRRVRFFVFKTVQFSLFGLMLIPFVVTRKNPYLSARMVLSIFAAWIIAYMAAGSWLNKFRCPRCGKLYYWRWELKGSTERQKRWRDCHYCGLHQDQMPQQVDVAIAGVGPG